MKIDTATQNILKQCRCAGDKIYLPATGLDRKSYEAVNKVLDCLGGKWNRSSKAHVFKEDVSDIFADTINTGEVSDRKKEFQFFATPKVLAARMVELLSPQQGDRILEPSAGNGNLANAVHALTGDFVEVCELMPENLKHLNKLSSCKILCEDFLKLPATEQFDRIIANPPFCKGQDISHVLKMWDHLKAGGRLVTITAPGWTFRDDQKHFDFRQWLQDVNADVEELPEGTFKESGTMIKAMLVAVDKS